MSRATDAARSQQAQAASDSVQSVSERLLRIYNGERGQEWESYILTPLQWKQVQVLAKEALQSDKIRHDYVRGQLVIRMPCPVHCHTAFKTGNLILQSLHDQLGESHTKDLEGVGTSDVDSQDGKRSPD